MDPQHGQRIQTHFDRLVDCSPMTVKRSWQLARAWLSKKLGTGDNKYEITLT